MFAASRQDCRVGGRAPLRGGQEAYLPRPWRVAPTCANALLGTHPPPLIFATLFPSSIRRRVANAEVLRWQARWRLVFGLFVGLVGGGLHGAGLLAVSPVAASLLGTQNPLLAEALLTIAYLTVVFVADTLCDRQPFGKQGKRLVIVALANQRQASHEAAEEQRDEQTTFACQRHGLCLEAIGLIEVAEPVAHQPRRR